MSAADADGDALTLAVVGSAGAVIVGAPASPVVVYTPQRADVPSLTVTVTASDGVAAPVSASRVVTVALAPGCGDGALLCGVDGDGCDASCAIEPDAPPSPPPAADDPGGCACGAAEDGVVWAALGVALFARRRRQSRPV